MTAPSVRHRVLLPLATAYGAALQLRDRLDRARRRPRLELPGVTLSLGSLSAGGAGKTPVVAELATLLSSRGYPVRILSRGYRRSGSGVERVDPEGDARRFGDEPMLLAQRTGQPVFVGGNRHAAGQLALREAPSPEALPVFLLDDGFQHRRLARDLDIVLLTGSELQDTLLPAGRLREPLEALTRADAIVLREEETESLSRFLEVLLRDRHTEPMLWTVRRSLEASSATAQTGSRPLFFCGLARPEGFFDMARRSGLVPAGTLAFRDHQRYGAAEVRRLLRAAQAAGADGFVTTEKDAVKLTPELRAALAPVGPVAVAPLQVKFLDERRMLEQLVGAVEKLNRRRGRR